MKSEPLWSDINRSAKRNENENDENDTRICIESWKPWRHLFQCRINGERNITCLQDHMRNHQHQGHRTRRCKFEGAQDVLPFLQDDVLLCLLHDVLRYPFHIFQDVMPPPNLGIRLWKSPMCSSFALAPSTQLVRLVRLANFLWTPNSTRMALCLINKAWTI